MTTFYDTFSDGALGSWNPNTSDWTDTGTRLEHHHTESQTFGTCEHPQSYAYGRWEFQHHGRQYFGSYTFFVSDGSGTASSNPDNGYAIVTGGDPVYIEFRVISGGSVASSTEIATGIGEGANDVTITRASDGTFDITVDAADGSTYTATTTDTTHTTSTTACLTGTTNNVNNETFVWDNIRSESPLGLTVSQGAEGQLDLSWDDVSASGYTIYRTQSTHTPEDGSSPSTANYTQIDSVGGSTFSYTDTGLEDGELYYYRVESSGSFNSADYLSNEASATAVLPAASSLSLDTSVENEISLSWTRNDDTSDGGWEIYRSTDGTLGSLTATLAPTTTSYTDTELPDGEKFYYTLRRYTDHAQTDSPQSSAVTILPAPSALAVMGVTGDDVSVSWTDNSDNEDGFRVYYSGDDGATWSTTPDLAADTTSHTVADLLDGERYRFAVAAFTEHTEIIHAPGLKSP